MSLCQDCNGSGRCFAHYGSEQYDFDAVDCTTCKGTGSVEDVYDCWVLLHGAWRRCRILFAAGSSGPHHYIGPGACVVELAEPLVSPSSGDALRTWPAHPQYVGRACDVFDALKDREY